MILCHTHVSIMCVPVLYISTMYAYYTVIILPILRMILLLLYFPLVSPLISALIFPYFR